MPRREQFRGIDSCCRCWGARLEQLGAHASWRALPVFERCGYRRVALERVRLNGETLGRVLMSLDLR